jgi:hypothetical protein
MFDRHYSLETGRGKDLVSCTFGVLPVHHP